MARNRSLMLSNKLTSNDREIDSNEGSKRSRASTAARSPSSRTRTPRPPSLQDNIKVARFARTIRDELSDIIATADIKANNYPDDDLLRGIAIVDVEVSADMSIAKVIISVLGNSVEKRMVHMWLCDNVGQVRFSLAKRIRHARHIPSLSFKLMDPQMAEMMNIMEEEALKRQLNTHNISPDIEFDEDDDDE